MNIRSLVLATSLASALAACHKHHGVDDNDTKPVVYDSTPSPFMQKALVVRDAYHKDSAWLQLPVHYNSGFDTEKYPLLLFLNGRGEASENGNLSKMLKWGPPHFMADSVRFQFDVAAKNQGMIVVCPQTENGYPTPLTVNQTIDYMVAKYRVDVSRIYLTGLSSGGAAVLSYLTYSPQYTARVAAAVPMSSLELETEKIANLKFIAAAATPVKIFCGTSDDLYLKNKSYADTINFYNPGLAIFTPYSGAHSNWNQRYDPSHASYNPNMYEWLLQYHK